MQVLHVADREAFTRFGVMFRQLGLAISNEGVDVALLTDDFEAAADLDGTPVTDYYLRSLHSGWLSPLESRLRRLLPEPPDLVHLWGTACLNPVSHWTAGHRIPLIVHVTADEEVEAIRTRGLRPHEQLLAMCRGYSEALLPRLAGEGAAAGADIEIAPPALLAPTAVQETRPGDRTIGIVWAGRMETGAGLELLIDAVAWLRQREIDLQLALIGDGPEVDRVWRMIGDHGVAEIVSMTDGVKIWNQVLAGADICVLPARQQRLTLAPLLAMACGKLVIASDDQPADWFVHDQTALLFAAGDARGLAGAVQRYAEGHPGALAVRRAARDYVVERHSASQAARRLVALYRELRERVMR